MCIDTRMKVMLEYGVYLFRKKMVALPYMEQTKQNPIFTVLAY